LSVWTICSLAQEQELYNMSHFMQKHLSQDRIRYLLARAIRGDKIGDYIDLAWRDHKTGMSANRQRNRKLRHGGSFIGKSKRPLAMRMFKTRFESPTL
jgi:hypothetical protein